MNEKLWKTIISFKNYKILGYRFLIYPNEQETIKKAGLPLILIYKDNSFKIEAGVVRSAPLFYKIEKDTVYVSDDVNKLIRNEVEYDLLSFMEFLSLGYVLSNRTLLTNIYTLQAGEILEYRNGTLKIYDKFLYDTSSILHDVDKKTLLEALWEIINSIFINLRRGVNGKRIVVPLSSGIDSRFIAAMLKLNGFEDVLCINYGIKGNYETSVSKKVADKLGYEWLFIEYSPQRLVQLFKSENFVDYIKMVHNFHTTPNIQEFLSTLFIKEEYGDEDFLFIPGHTGDFISGGHITKQVLAASNIKSVADAILKRHYELRYWPPPKKLEEDLIKYLKCVLQKVGPLASYQLYEIFDWRERQSKYIINTSKAYEFFGFQWHTPLWDKRFVDFWSSIPLRFKYNKKLYKDFLAEYIFGPLGIDFEKNKERAYVIPNVIRHFIGNFLGKIGLIKKPNPCGFDRTLSYLAQQSKNCYARSVSHLHHIKKHLGIRGHKFAVSYVTDFAATVALNTLDSNIFAKSRILQDR
ncbi:MAG: asparagine synthase C-terminal domain-containing protein [Nitrososphaeria archaeon]